MLLTFGVVHDGIQECRLDLALLYPHKHDRDKFERRWDEFYHSDPIHPNLFCRPNDDALVYQTESFIPTLIDSRPPVIILLGNPASHSVASGMCFAYEGGGCEHRFWAAFRETGLLKFNGDDTPHQKKSEELNGLRNAQIFSLDYTSPFRIGIVTYYTMPSSASRPPWSGVSGLRRLMGSKALASISALEHERIKGIVCSFLSTKGGIIVFQRDAYEGVRDLSAPSYTLAAAMDGRLYGRCVFDPLVYVIGIAPTRYLNAKQVRSSLVRSRSYLVDQLQA